MIMTAIKDYKMDKGNLEEQGNPSDILPPQLAAEYLGTLYRRPFTRKDFGNLRSNNRGKLEELGIEPVYKSGSTSNWRRGDLDIIARSIPAPEYRPAVRKERKKRRTDSEA